MKNKKINFKVLFIVLGVVVLLGGGLTFLLTKNKAPTHIDEVIVDVNKDDNLVKRKVYVLSNDNMVVPLTVSYDKKDSLADELYYLTSLLRVDNGVIKGSYKGVLPKDTSILSLSIQDKILTLGLSKEFYNYDVKNEIRIIEALVWTYSQFDEIDALELKIENELLTKMPLGKTPLPNKLTKEFGINNHIFPSDVTTNRVVTYYSKSIDGIEVFVPVSNNIEEEDISVFLELSKSKAPLYTGLYVNEVFKSIDVVNANITENDILLELTSSCLLEENLVSKEIYEVLQVMLSSYNEDLVVSILVEGEIVAVEGQIEEEIIKVSDVIYNEIKI